MDILIVTLSLLIIVIASLAIVVMILRRVRNIRKSAARLTNISFAEIPEDGLEIPLIASFRGIKYVPLIAVAYNNVSPKLIIHGDKVVFRVMIQFTKRYEDISRVSMFMTFGTANIQITFKNSPLTFSGNVLDKEVLKNLLSFFKKKGATLSKEAEGYIIKG